MADPASSKRVADVDVCICTFRRSSLTQTVASIAAQRNYEGRVRIIIADNDDTPSAASMVDRLKLQGLDIDYLHAPARNISIARNACLDAATAGLVAFIDDDEVADPTWLAELVLALDDPACAAVFGPVAAVYSPDAPDWVRQADLHSTSPVQTARGIDTGYTSNALVRRAVIAGTRFDVSLGRSGGEDTDLFTRLYEQGHRFGGAPRAIVRESVTCPRMTLGWLVRRAFRSGQTHARRYLGSPFSRTRGIIVTVIKAGACGLIALSRIASPAGWRRAIVRASLHLGVAARLVGMRDRELYG